MTPRPMTPAERRVVAAAVRFMKNHSSTLAKAVLFGCVHGLLAERKRNKQRKRVKQ